MKKIDLEVIENAYGWSISSEGEVLGLVAGDMGYEHTGIFIPLDHIEAFKDDAYEGLRKEIGRLQLALTDQMDSSPSVIQESLWQDILKLVRDYQRKVRKEETPGYFEIIAQRGRERALKEVVELLEKEHDMDITALMKEEIK